MSNAILTNKKPDFGNRALSLWPFEPHICIKFFPIKNMYLVLKDFKKLIRKVIMYSHIKSEKRLYFQEKVGKAIR